ncbi:hypothetical protein JCM10296v2_004880 [Rhodotorula toruloides]
MAFLSKPTILFISLNVLRFLSVVAICLVFAGEIYTIDRDIKGMHAVAAASSSSAPPSTTASLRITRRSAVIEPLLASSTIENPLTALARPTTSPVRFEKVHRALQRRLAYEDRLSKREHIMSSTAAVTAGKKATSTAASPDATSVNSPVSSSTPAAADAQQSCSYVGRTSIPKGAGGALFSTLERIFAAVILVLSLISELPPPFAPLSRPARLLARFWAAFFPPFGEEYGVGVLGAVQVFIACQVLSHWTTGWVQVSAWLLFLVGIFNFLAGLAFGSRLKVLRSLSQDSTTPSAKRRLRLAAEPVSPSIYVEDDSGVAHSHAYERFDAAPPAKTDEKTKRRSFLPFTGGSKGGAKRSASRNGPTGIVISGPMMAQKQAGGVSAPPPVYQLGR